MNKNFISKIEGYASLPENWDGYHGKPITENVINDALVLFETVFSKFVNSLRLHIGPSADNEVVFTARKAPDILICSVFGDGLYHYYAKINDEKRHYNSIAIHDIEILSATLTEIADRRVGQIFTYINRPGMREAFVKFIGPVPDCPICGGKEEYVNESGDVVKCYPCKSGLLPFINHNGERDYVQPDESLQKRDDGLYRIKHEKLGITTLQYPKMTPPEWYRTIRYL